MTCCIEVKYPRNSKFKARSARVAFHQEARKIGQRINTNREVKVLNLPGHRILPACSNGISIDNSIEPDIIRLLQRKP